MVQLKEKSLIIELPCENGNQLALLTDLQKGLIDMVSFITYSDDIPPAHLKNGIYNLHILLREMLITQDQGSCITKGLTKAGIAEFNKWGERGH